MEDTSEIDPKDISYVHSVYAPLSVRIAEQLTKNDGWKQLQDVIGLLPGRGTVELIFIITGQYFTIALFCRASTDRRNSNDL